ncbi:metallophosphoesterase [Dehalobacter sp. DCM]|uniref:metallophosphoesterase family protein n=1 Tax=Dehalobacter sp. DCM TaxID=2907827 RepID=UPI003081A32F|nr:metallophosphoesterase [Dehalobacter sp. DCM]
MRIGIISDTHIRQGRTLASYVWKTLSEVDTIIHAGDIVSRTLLDDLETIAPVIAVRGNCDWSLTDLPDKLIADVGSIKIGITHGAMGFGKDTPDRAYNCFLNDEVDMIIFGHSHIPFKKYFEGILMFNPGSASERRSQAQCSIGILTVDKRNFNIQHLYFD